MIERYFQYNNFQIVVVIEIFQASFPGVLINENQQVKKISLLVKDYY